MKGIKLSDNRIQSCTDATVMTSYFAWVMRFFSYYFFYFKYSFLIVREA